MAQRGLTFNFDVRMLKIHCVLNYFKGNGIFLLQNDKTYFTYKIFEFNPPSILNTAKFDCLNLSGPGCK